MMRARLVIALLPIAGSAQAQPNDELVGIWRASADFGPKLHGPIVLRKTAHGYSASIGGRQVAASGADREPRFDFGRDGSFRTSAGGRSITGFWLQPNRDRSTRSYATPVHLRQVAPGTWRGEIVPLRDQFTLWLSIFRAPDGKLTAAFRNPQRNSTGGASRFDVTRSGDAIRFSAKRDQAEITQEARLLHGPDRIRIAWPDADTTLNLKRAGPSEAGAFYPRPPGLQPYVYRKPPQLADGWKTARASVTGIDEQALTAIIRKIASADPTARPPQLMHSILVAHQGKLVLEEYFYGFDRTMPHDTRSAGKTFASVMLGTAPTRHAGLSPDSRIYDVMRSFGPFANPDPRKREITLAHLMTHTSGLACNDNDDASPGNENTMQNQKADSNWWRYTLNLPQLFNPGTRYAYCSANTNLVGGALTQATHEWLPELFDRTIAAPLHFGEWHWNLMPNGEGYLGGGIQLLPRDLLKVGQMYLDGGLWNGRRVVPADWVRESTRARVAVTPQTTGLSEEDFQNFYIPAEDGLAWHLGSVTSGGRRHPTYQATGNGGQLLVVVPDADLAVVFTGGNYGQGGVWLRWSQSVIGDEIIPAIKQR